MHAAHTTIRKKKNSIMNRGIVYIYIYPVLDVHVIPCNMCNVCPVRAVHEERQIKILLSPHFRASKRTRRKHSIFSYYCSCHGLSSTHTAAPTRARTHHKKSSKSFPCHAKRHRELIFDTPSILALNPSFGYHRSAGAGAAAPAAAGMSMM